MEDLFPKVRQRFRLVAIPLTVFCWLGVWALFEVFPLWMPAAAQTGTSEAATKPVPASTSAEVEAKYQNLERMIGSTEKRLDNLQKLLAALATVGTLLGIALGVSTYLNLKEVQASAEKLLVKIQDDREASRKELKELKEEIRADFPGIARLNQKIAGILSELREQVFQEWDQNSYSRLLVSDRQGILLQEVTFRALHLFEFARIPAYSRMILEIQQGFGRFYSSRYTSSHPLDKAALERAVFYLTSVPSVPEADLYYAAQGDLGVLYAHQGELEKETWDHAIRYLTISRQPRDCDPRALITLSWIAKRQGLLPEAITFLDTLLAATDLTDREKTRYWPLGRYNRACYCVQQAKSEQEPARRATFQDAVNQLWKVKATVLKTNPRWWIDSLSRDIDKPDGDLVPLKDAFAEELKRLRDLTDPGPQT